MIFFRALDRLMKSTAPALCVLAVAAYAAGGCQEETKKRAPTAKASAKPTVPVGTSPVSTNPAGGGVTPGGGVPGVGGEMQCAKTDAKFVAECKKLAAPDNASCETDPIPQAVCDKVKVAAGGTTPGGTTTGGTTTGATAGGKDPNTCTVQTKDTALNVRKTASTSAPIIDTLPKDSTFTKTGGSGGWIKLKTAGGKEGFVCDSCGGGNFVRCGPETNLWDGPDEEPLRNPDGSWG